MKVLHVLSSLNVNSGIANVVMNYFRNIDRSQVQFDCLVFTIAEKRFDDEVEQLGGKIYKFTQPGLRTYFKAEKELDEFFRQHAKEYDIIHCHEILVAKMVFKYARKYGDVKCIAHSHSVKLSNSFLRAVRNRIVIAGLKNKCDYCFACSQKAGQSAFGKNIIGQKKYSTLYNAINLDNYAFSSQAREAVKREFSLDGNLVLGNVGRLSNEKNQKFAIDVLKSLVDKTKDGNIRLLLIGAGDKGGELKSYAKELALDNNVIFTGIRKDVPQLLCAMDYFVFPSLFEGFGITLLEAQASGLPSLCFENMPIEIKITDCLKEFSVKSTPEEWAEFILSDKEDRDRRGYCDKVKSKGFDIEKQAVALAEKYFDMLR